MEQETGERRKVPKAVAKSQESCYHYLVQTPKYHQTRESRGETQMTEEQFTQATQEAFNTSALVVCSAWKGLVDVDGDILGVSFQIAADWELGDNRLTASTLYEEVKIVETADIDKFLGILFAKITEEKGYGKALEWANSINLESVYEWFHVAQEIFKGRMELTD